MKKQIFFAAIICNLFIVQIAVAQNPVTTLQHKGTTKVYYGQTSLNDAYSASINGDTLYLSTGSFSVPSTISKGIKIIGAGYAADSADVARRTTISTGFKISLGADSLRLEGLYINGEISYDDVSINNVKVIRCTLGSAIFNSTSSVSSKNNCSFEECYIYNINFGSYGDNLLVRNSIISGRIFGAFGNAVIDGNVFTYSASSANFSILPNLQKSIVRNNIFYYGAYIGLNSTNTYNKNLALRSTTAWINNYNISVTESAILASDYHLINPTTYLGTDKTPIGIYGGQSFKANGVPSNPAILSKTIAPRTDANGNLQISITVKAQDN